VTTFTGIGANKKIIRIGKVLSAGNEAKAGVICGKSVSDQV
jgi:hypothetical protein